MRRLILMRHAKSSWADPGQRDLDRPLNKRGRRSAGLIGGWLKAQGLPARPGAGVERAAHPGDLVGRRRRGRRRAETTYVPELYHAGPDAMLAVLRARRRRGLRADARPPARHRRLRASGCWPSRRPTPTSPSTRPAATAVIDFDAAAWSEVGWGEGRLADFVVPRALE